MESMIDLSRTVIITVSGGVASIDHHPEGITVIIRDYDDCEAGSDADYCTEQPS